MKRTVCVDLDGVLAHYDGWKGADHIGEPRPGAREFMAGLQEFARVVVFTTRCKADMADRPPDTRPEDLAKRVQAWLDRHGIPCDEVYVGQGKPIASAYIDDRAVAIPSNPGPADFTLAAGAAALLCGIK